MKAWQVHQYCEPEQMSFDEVQLPDLAPDEVLIRDCAAGVNFFDILQIQGKYQSKPAFPFTVGGEVAGIVEAVGPGVSRFSVGERVLAFTRGGGYAEYSLVPEEKTFAIPEAMSFEEAAALPVVYQTSYYALDYRAGLRPGEWLLVHAGASGVGMAAIQIGKARNAQVIATAGRPEKLDFCRALGADHAISYRGEDWVEQVKKLTGGRGADVIYDPVGGDVFDLSTRCTAPDGRLLVVGFTSGRIPSVAANRVLLKNMAVVGAFWGRHVDEHPEYLAQTQAAILKLYDQGAVRPVVSRTYALAEAPRALADLAQRNIAGKAVLTTGRP